MRVTLIHNLSAGTGECTRDDLMTLLARASHDSVRYVTRDEWEDALADPGDLVVAAGGDGTVAKIAGAFAGRGVPLAILPLGTANNVATQLGWGEDLEQIAAGWSAMRSAPFDIGTCAVGGRRRWFLESVGCGLFSDTMAAGVGAASEAQDRDSRIEGGRRALRAQAEACVPRARRLVVEGTDRSGEHLLVEVMNFGALGPRICLAPQARPQDGRLHVVLVPERDRAELRAHLERSSIDRSSPPPFEVTEARRVELTCQASDLHIDGKLATEVDPWGPPEGPITVDIALRAGAVELLLPRA